MQFKYLPAALTASSPAVLYITTGVIGQSLLAHGLRSPYGSMFPALSGLKKQGRLWVILIYCRLVMSRGSALGSTWLMVR